MTEAAIEQSDDRPVDTQANNQANTQETEVKRQKESTQFNHKDYTENCHNISGADQVAFVGRTDRKYDILADPCCWAVCSIKEWPLDHPDPPRDTWFKSYRYGLSAWEVLACDARMGDISHPACVEIGDTRKSPSVWRDWYDEN